MPQIPLTKGQLALVDDCDHDTLTAIGKWCFSNSGYAMHYYVDDAGKRKTLYMHRLVMQRILCDVIPADFQVDHINLNRLDNRRENLRLATRSQNQAHKGRQSNTSCYKGVNANRGRWEARIRFQGRRFFLGKYDHAKMAAQVYDAASRHFYQDFSGCNFPDEATPPRIEELLQAILAKRKS
jgi:hypothetical protein